MCVCVCFVFGWGVCVCEVGKLGSGVKAFGPRLFEVVCVVERAHIYSLSNQIKILSSNTNNKIWAIYLREDVPDALGVVQHREMRLERHVEAPRPCFCS
jgi:hypothetical protein